MRPLRYSIYSTEKEVNKMFTKKVLATAVVTIVLFVTTVAANHYAVVTGKGTAPCSYLLGPADANGVSPVLAGGCGAAAYRPARADSPNALAASYRTLRLYDGSLWTLPMIDYYGASPCTDTIKYGDPQIPSAYNNRTNSASSFNQCHYLYLYDGANYTSFWGSCSSDPGCGNLGTFNNRLTSWKLFF